MAVNFEWLLNPLAAIALAFAGLIFCGVFQAGLKTQSAVQLTTGFYCTLAVLMALISFGYGRSLDAGNAGSWGLGGLLGLGSAFVWAVSCVPALIFGGIEARKKDHSGDE